MARAARASGQRPAPLGRLLLYSRDSTTPLLPLIRPLLLVLLLASSLAVSHAASLVSCPSVPALSVSLSTANLSALFADGSFFISYADGPETCVRLAQETGCSGAPNLFYVFSTAGFSPDKGGVLGTCLYGAACPAKGLPKGSSPVIVGSVDPLDCVNLLPCPFGEEIRSIGLDLSYSPDGSNFIAGGGIVTTADSASACRDYAASQSCGGQFRKRAALKGSAAGRRGQGVAPSPFSGGDGGGNGGSTAFFVYLPEDNFTSQFFDETTEMGNCLASFGCGSLPPGDSAAIFGNTAGACALAPGPQEGQGPGGPIAQGPSSSYSDPPPPPPLKLAACPTGTEWGDTYLDLYNAFASFKRGAPFQYAAATSLEECYQAALNDTCLGNPVDFVMFSLMPLSENIFANCAWGTCKGLAQGTIPAKVVRLNPAQCSVSNPPPVPMPPAPAVPPMSQPRRCREATRYFRHCSCSVANASCQKIRRCGNRYVCTCKSGNPMYDPETDRLQSCAA